MALLLNLLLLYVAIIIVTIAHELGHMSKKIKFIKFFPFPSAIAFDSRFRYGGLLVNVLIFYFIWKTQPTNFFLQLIGLVSWLHFMSYPILKFFSGKRDSFIIRKIMKNHIVVHHFESDVPHSRIGIFLLFAFIAFLQFRDYYIPILTSIFGGGI